MLTTQPSCFILQHGTVSTVMEEVDENTRQLMKVNISLFLSLSNELPSLCIALLVNFLKIN
uniref:Uncharacterized protein n=1 Tax=Anguilla anguilla TaxID=7936 RepID=A0A0E9R6T6_ANGAN